jgi:hypothetical protein
MDHSIRRLTFAATGALCLALVTTSASAQFGGMGGGMGGGMRRGGGGADRGARKPDAASSEANRRSLADRLYQLRMRLLITPEQTPAWERLYAAFQALQQPTFHSAAMSDAGSTIQTMQQALSQAQDRYTLIEALSDALKPLYAQLNVEQKATADDLLPALITDATRSRDARDRAPD